MSYLFSSETLKFYASEYIDRYPNLPSDIIEVSDEVFAEYSAQPPSGKVLSSENGFPAWGDAPEPDNSQKRKAALSELSRIYQEDIAQLNIAWLAAAVSDGVSEGTKKDAVIVQIDARKALYASDRAAIIAQYP